MLNLVMFASFTNSSVTEIVTCGDISVQVGRGAVKTLGCVSDCEDT